MPLQYNDFIECMLHALLCTFTSAAAGLNRIRTAVEASSISTVLTNPSDILSIPREASGSFQGKQLCAQGLRGHV